MHGFGNSHPYIDQSDAGDQSADKILVENNLSAGHPASSGFSVQRRVHGSTMTSMPAQTAMATSTTSNRRCAHTGGCAGGAVGGPDCSSGAGVCELCFSGPTSIVDSIACRFPRLAMKPGGQRMFQPRQA